LLADLVVAEVVYVLESFYQVSRERLAELVRSISAHHSCSGRMTGRPVSYARAHD
jgi:predicted nucleic-acid-binding protein